MKYNRHSDQITAVNIRAAECEAFLHKQHAYQRVSLKIIIQESILIILLGEKKLKTNFCSFVNFFFHIRYKVFQCFVFFQDMIQKTNLLLVSLASKLFFFFLKLSITDLVSQHTFIGVNTNLRIVVFYYHKMSKLLDFYMF